MKRLRLLARILKALWSSGLLQLSPSHWSGLVGAYWRCRNSYAFLAELAALRHPHGIALHDSQGCLSFAQLHQLSLHWAGWLGQHQGVGPGQAVAILYPNERSFVLAVLALTRLGADVLPLGSDLPPQVLNSLLQRQKPSLLIHHPDMESSLHDCPVPHTAVPDDLSGAPPRLPRVTRAGQLVVLTSGSTGISKGIRRRPSLGQLLPALAGLLDSLPFRMGRPFVLAIPLFHGYGLATLAMSLALTAPLRMNRRYHIAPLLEAQDQPALLVTVPTLLYRWLQSQPPRPRLVAVITGSAPLDAALCRRLLDHLGPILFNLYGSSEAGLIAMATPAALEQAPGSVGRPLPGNEVRLVPPGGRILVRGPLVLQPGPDGWRDTGDLGRWDQAGNLYVVGRADSMVVSGGENVFPHEIEEVLLGHPQIGEASLVVVPDDEFGQRMLAGLVAQPDLTVEALRDWLRQRLERYKMPRHIAIFTQLPRNPLGKIDRAALRQLLLEDEQTHA